MRKNRVDVPGTCVLAGTANPQKCWVDFPATALRWSVLDTLDIQVTPLGTPTVINLKCTLAYRRLDQ
jgi:hypothetical protein